MPDAMKYIVAYTTIRYSLTTSRKLNLLYICFFVTSSFIMRSFCYYVKTPSAQQPEKRKSKSQDTNTRLGKHPRRLLPTTKKLALQPSRLPTLARRHAHALSHIIHDSRLSAQFAHVLDALTQLSEKGD